jgi:hypothetical protein
MSRRRFLNTAARRKKHLPIVSRQPTVRRNGTSTPSEDLSATGFGRCQTENLIRENLIRWSGNWCAPTSRWRRRDSRRTATGRSGKLFRLRQTLGLARTPRRWSETPAQPGEDKRKPRRNASPGGGRSEPVTSRSSCRRREVSGAGAGRSADGAGGVRSRPASPGRSPPPAATCGRRTRPD